MTSLLPASSPTPSVHLHTNRASSFTSPTLVIICELPALPVPRCHPWPHLQQVLLPSHCHLPVRARDHHHHTGLHCLPLASNSKRAGKHAICSAAVIGGCVAVTAEGTVRTALHCRSRRYPTLLHATGGCVAVIAEGTLRTSLQLVALLCLRSLAAALLLLPSIAGALPLTALPCFMPPAAAWLSLPRVHCASHCRSRP